VLKLAVQGDFVPYISVAIHTFPVTSFFFFVFLINDYMFRHKYCTIITQLRKMKIQVCLLICVFAVPSVGGHSERDKGHAVGTW
jgi:hypothetical protein